METLDFPSSKLNWEPIGKYGMCVAVWQDFIWVTGKSGQVHCMTMDTANELTDWLIDTLLRRPHAKQESPAAEDDARHSEWFQAAQRWTSEESS
jgi:hypothetical protein